MRKPSSDLRISVPPLRNPFADYLKAVNLSIQLVNGFTRPILIESIALRFQSDLKLTATDLTVDHPCEGVTIQPDHMVYENVTVTPALFYKRNTNVFDVTVTYRRQRKRALSKSFKQLQREVSSLIIRAAPNIYGNIFISYKEPEDRDLADQFFAFAEAAGFTPYIAPADLKPGSKIWRKKIPQAIKSSKAAFVIWTSKTHLGAGVRKEIGICGRNNVPIVLLLEDGVNPPAEHKPDEEWTPFTRDNSALVFANVIRSYREMQGG
jgi:hypothetical protein